MGKARLSFGATLLASVFIFQTASAQPNRTYTGQIESSGRYVSAVTTFKTDNQGRIGGSYHYTENKRRYPGTLDNCEYNGSVNLRCVWRGHAGKGVATFAFNNGSQQFIGLWKGKDGENLYGWSGGKQSNRQAKK